MMVKQLIASAAAAAVVSTTLLAAQSQSPASQTPAGSQSQPPASQTPPRAPDTAAAAQPGSDITLVGCLYREREIPGRAPNVVERLGVGEDYVLADARPAGSQTQGLATGRMYKVENINDEQLGALAGRRVEVIGRIDSAQSDVTPGGRPAPDRNPVSPDDINLPEFEARSIRQVEGTCPAVPVTTPAPAASPR
jgi:hypothetical protein